MVRDTGFEPVTPSVSGKCSTTELTAHSSLKDREKPRFRSLSAFLADAQNPLFHAFLQAQKTGGESAFHFSQNDLPGPKGRKSKAQG
jgi:hypothetical protein